MSYQRMRCEDSQRERLRLSWLLWWLWTLAVLGAAIERWYDAVQQDMPVDITHLIIRCLLVGSWGLVIIAALDNRRKERLSMEL